MDRKTIFVIVFVIISFAVFWMYATSNPVPGGNRFHLPEPRNIEVNGVSFPVSWGFIEDENSSDVIYYGEVLNHNVSMAERIFHQNDILLLDIAVYDLGVKIDINDLNDGTYHSKSVNGVEGIFKNESVNSKTGFVKNSHQRYYFDYIKDGKIVMIQCDKLKTIEDIVS